MVKKPEPLTVVVKVVGNYRVVHDGVPYTSGDMPEIPAALAEAWLKVGWVTTEV